MNKKRILLIALTAVLIASLCLVGCGSEKKTINFIVDGEVYGTISTSGNEVLKLPANPEKAGYDFDGWYFDKDLWQSTLTEKTFEKSSLTMDVYAYAKWTLKEVEEKKEVNFIVDGEVYGAISTSGNEVLKLPANLEKAGYDFDGWYFDKDLWQSPLTEKTLEKSSLTMDVYAYAKWNPKEFVATFMDGDSVVGTAKFTVESKDITEPTLPERQGYSSQWEVYELKAENITVRSRYTPIKYSITYANVDGAKNDNKTDYTIEDSLTLSTPTKDNYSFEGWFEDEELTKQVSEIETGTVGEKTFFAKWSKPIWEYTNDGKIVGLLIDKNTVTELIIPDIIDGTVITSIGESAFYACTGLTSVIIPDGVTSIGSYAFYNCVGLTNVTVPDSVTSIGSNAFDGCNNLKYNEYDNAYYLGCNENPYVVLMKSKDKSITSFLVNEKTKVIYSYAFEVCTRLMSVTIPDSVTSIGKEAFNYCDKLVEVINNSSLNITKGSEDNGYVGYYALSVKKGGTTDIVNKDGYLFYTYNGVNYLLGYTGTDTDLTLPENYDGQNYDIYKYAFYGCRGLTSVTIGSGVTSIGSSAFRNCTGLTSVTIGNGVTSIGDSVFFDCSGLTSVTIPDNVKSISSYAFYDCTGLKTIYYKGTETQWNTITKESSWDVFTGNYTIVYNA